MDDRKSLADVNKVVESKPEEKQRSESPAPAAEEAKPEQTPQQPVAKADLVKQPVETKTAQVKAEVKKESKPENKETKKPRTNPFAKFNRLFSKLSVLSPGNLKRKVNSWILEANRVLKLSRKPTEQEYKELAIMVAVGTAVIGAIGFVIQLIIQVI